LLKGVAEVKEAERPIAAAEMVLVRIAYAADLPSPEDVIRSLSDAPQPPLAAAAAGRHPLPTPLPPAGEGRVGAVAFEAAPCAPRSVPSPSPHAGESRVARQMLGPAV